MSLNHDKIKQRHERSNLGFGWKPKENTNRIRILPPGSRFLAAWDQLEDCALLYHIHYFKREGKQTEVSRCLAELKQPCPACETYRAFKKSTDLNLAERVKEIKPTAQYLMNIIDINDPQKGLQVWAANWTCWDAIITIMGKAAWGNVLDPANGRNFEVTLTPGTRTKTGRNSYSVTPEPNLTTIMPFLETIPNWQAALDTLDQNITAPKTADEISTLLDEMGFPTVGNRRPVGTPQAAVPSYGGVTAPVSAAVPAVSIPGVAAQPAPAPVVSTPAIGTGVPLVAPVTTAAPAINVAVPAVPAVEQTIRPNVASVLAPQAQSVHYDPGPGYQPKVADGERPAGVPRCFGDYAPDRHRCGHPCPAIVDCQLRLLEMY